jgi:dTDP-4-dehydrorhamnose reductase
VVNLVALTDVEECQRDPQAAYSAHVRVNQNLAEHLDRQSESWVLNISTDHVYDSDSPSPESAIVIRNAYALSKLAGELALPKERAISLRTNFFGRGRGRKRSLSDWVVDQFRAYRETKLLGDCHFSPLAMSTLSREILHILRRPHAGVYNLGASSFLSKAEFALRVAHALHLEARNYEIIRMDQLPQRTARPKGMAMDSSLYCKTFNQNLPSLEEEIQSLEQEYA